ncbi:MAG: hypothetical protein PUG90_03540 [Clostridia bacterium]|nr:hypothetical protein [Clostridia bacterium]MDY4083269.1 hypothetical protein [Eubacteriales bacterium]
MAKKNKIDLNEIQAKDNRQSKAKKAPKAKKSHGCLTCIITLVVIFVVLVAGIAGGGVWAWGKYVEPQVGLSISEAFQFLTSLYKADEKQIVTNPYTSSDLDSFYSEFKAKTYMSADSDITIVDILDSATSAKSSESSSTETAMALAEDAPTGTGNAALDDLLNKIEFDFSSLSTYSGEENILEVTDKQFAAVIDSVLQYYVTQSASSEDSALGAISQYAPYLKHVKVSQVVIDSVAGARIEDVILSLTIKIDIASLAPQLLEGTPVPAFVAGLLPKKVFITMDVKPNAENGQASIGINQIDRDLMSKIEGILNKFAGGETPIMQTINDAVKSVVQKLNTVIPLTFVDSGCDMKPVEGLMNVLGVELGEAQFLCLIRDFKLPTASDVGLDSFTDELRTQNLATFIDEFTTKYGFDNSGNDITTDNVFTSITGLMQDDAMLEKLNLATLQYDTSGYNAAGHKVGISYLALAGLLNSQLARGSEEASAFPITVLNMAYDQTNEMLEVYIAVDVMQAVVGNAEEGSLIAVFAPQILPEQIFIKARLSLTDDPSKPTEICVNRCDVEQTTELLNNLNTLCGSLGINVSGLNLTELTSKLEKSVRDNLTNINTKLGTDIEFISTQCILPSIFETVSGLEMLKDEGGVAIVDDRELHDMLRATYTFESATANASDSATGFVSELENKYYLTTGLLDANDGSALLNSVTTIKDNFESSIDVDKMARDKSAIDTLKPILTQEELGFLIQSSGKLDNIVSVLTGITVVSTDITATKLNMQISGKISLTGENAKYAVLLPDKVYVNVYVDTVALKNKIAGADVTCTSFDIDGMTVDEMNDFFELATKLGGGEVTATKVGKALENNIFGFMSDIEAGGTIEIVFQVGAMKLNTTVFDIAIDQIYSGSDPSLVPTNVGLRSVLQKINVIPDELAQNNIASDMSRLASDVSDKYYLNTPMDATADVSSQIATISRDYSTLISGQAMADDTRVVTDGVALKPQASGGELGKLLSGDVTVSAEGMKDVTMISLTVTSTTTLRIVFTASVESQSTDKYAKLLPTSVAIVVEVDTAKVSGSEVCTDFTINDMTGEDLDVFCNLFKVVVLKDKSIDPDTINAEASGKVKAKMSDMTGGATMTYDTADINADCKGGTVTFPSIYGVAINNIYSDGIKPSEELFQSMMKSLFTLTPTVGQTGINATTDKMTSGQIDASYVLTPTPHGEVVMEINDRNIAATLLAKEDSAEGGVSTALGLTKESVSYKQVLMFNPNYANVTAVKQGLSGMTFTENHSYMLMTLNITTSALMTKTTTLLPDSIDATIFIDVDATDYATTLMFNNMTEGEQKILKDIVNSNRTASEGDTTLFDSTATLKNKILGTEIISINKVGSVTIPEKKWTIKDILDNVVKVDGYGVRHSGNTLFEGNNYGGFIRIEQSVTI